MGLDIVCSCGFHVLKIGYSAFFHLRAAVSGALGYNYELMIHSGDTKIEARCQRENPALYTLISHSDCDGSWTTAECAQVMEALKAAIATGKLKDDGFKPMRATRTAGGGVNIDFLPPSRSFEAVALELLGALDHCVSKQHSVNFC